MNRELTSFRQQPRRLAVFLLYFLLFGLITLQAGATNLTFQGFENGSIDGGWTTDVYSGKFDWDVVQTDLGTGYETCDPHSGSYMAMYDAWDAPLNDGSYLISPALDFSDKGSATFSFWMYRDPTTAQTQLDRVEIYISTSTSTTNGTVLDTIFRKISGDPVVSSGGWYQYTYNLDLDTYDGATNYIIVKAISGYGSELFIDDLSVDAEPMYPDAGISNITADSPFHVGSQHIFATIKDYGKLRLTSADINWSVSYDGKVVGSGVMPWTGNLTRNNTAQVDLGAFDFEYPAGTTDFKSFNISAYTTNANGKKEEQNPANDKYSVDLTPVLNDAAVVDLTSPGSGFLPGTQPVKVLIKNLAPKPITSLSVGWSVDGVDQTPVAWTGNLAYGQTAEVSLGSYYFTFKTPIGPFDIKSWTSQPNGVNDELHGNDTLNAQAAPSLSAGTFYVGGANAHFNDVQSAANYLSVSGVVGGGTLTYIIRPGTYNVHMNFDNFAQGKAIVVFKSETNRASDVVLYDTPSGTEKFLWRINGNDNVQFQNLTFSLQGGSDGSIFELTGGTENITLTNVVLNSIAGMKAPENSIIYSHDNPGVSMNITGSTFNYGSAAILETTPSYKGAISVVKNTFVNQVLPVITIPFSRGAVISDNLIKATGIYRMAAGIILTNGGTVTNNTISGVAGLQLDPNEAVISIRNDDPANIAIVEGNTISNAANLHGIFVETQQGRITNNSVTINNAAGTDFGGIRVINTTNNGGYFMIQGNKVNAFGANGIQAYGSLVKIYRNFVTATGTDKYVADLKASSGFVANNMLSGGDNKGVSIENPVTFGIYYNTIVLNSPTNPALVLSYGDVTVMRNLIMNLAGGPAISASNFTTAGKLTSNENDIFSTGPVLAYWDGKSIANLAAWQTATSQDLASIDGMTNFKSITNLHLDKFSEGTYTKVPLDLPSDLNAEIQMYDIDNELRYTYFYGADNVNPQVNIIVQPKALIDCAGSTAHQMQIVAEVTFGGTPSFQWEKDGVPINGATDAILNLPPLTYDMSGLYRVKVMGNGGADAMYSDYVLLYVLKPTEITSQPQSQFAENGTTIRVNVGTHVYNDLPEEYNPSFQWYRGTMALTDNDRVAGTRSSILSIRDIQPGDIGDDYYVVITGLCGTVQSNKFSLMVPPDVTVTLQSENVTACEGTTANLVVDAVPSVPNVTLTYQWRFNGNDIADDARITGTTTKSLVINNATQADEGDYDVVVTISETGKVVTSSKAVLTIDAKPSIRTQPAPVVSVKTGDPLTLTVDAAGDGTLSYQWYKDGVIIDGATSATYTKPVTAAGDEGAYTVKVTNSCGEVSSNASVVTLTYFTILSSDEAVSGGYALMPNQPNPVNGTTTIKYFVPSESQVRLTLTDAFGREVAVLADKTVSAGEQSVTLNTSDFNLASGVYYYTLTTGSIKLTNRMLIVR